MGWNDRMLEDPYWAYQNEDDRQSYENWQMYIESQLIAETALTSQTLQPDDLRRLTEIKNDVSQTETNRTATDDEDSRQPAHHQEEPGDRRTHAPANSQDIQEQHQMP